MSYKEPVGTTEFADISIHNRADMAPDHAWIVSPKSGKDTLSFLETASTDELKDLFQAVANLEEHGSGKFILLHAVDPESAVQHTNSKLPNLHFNVLTNDFAESYNHVSDPNVKSYTVQPNPNLGALIDQQEKPHKFHSVQYNKDNGGEISAHKIITHGSFASLTEFSAYASTTEWEDLRETLISSITPWLQPDKGGVRIIIDNRYLNTSCLTIQVLAGENMDRSGQNKQRWFQKPFDLEP